MSRIFARLAPFRGMRTEHITDEALPGTHMRGGFNVEVNGGEWWVRKGEQDHPVSNGGVAGTDTSRAMSNPWWWGIEDPTTTGMVLANRKYMVRWSAQYDVPFSRLSEVSKASCGVTTGDATVTISDTSSLAVGDYATDETDFIDTSGISLYRIRSITTNTSIELDRPYEGADATLTMLFLTQLLGSADGDIEPDDPAYGGMVVFEQEVTHSSSSLGYSNPATTGGEKYCILVTRSGYAAVDLDDNTDAPLKSWFRFTNLSTPTEISANPVAVRPVVYKGRLWLASGLVLYYSRPYDFLQWHTGIQGLTAAPNSITLDRPDDPIHDMAVLGEYLVIHRRYSHDFVQSTGDPAAPFRVFTAEKSIGCEVQGSVVVANEAHYFWSLSGPAMLDEQGARLAAPELYSMLRSWSLVGARLTDGSDDPVGFKHGFHDAERQRVYWILSSGTTTGGGNRVARHPRAGTPAGALVSTDNPTDWYSAGSVLVHDYVTGDWWLEDRVTPSGGATERGRAYVFRYDGMVNVLHSNASGKDEPTTAAGTAHVVDAMAETDWEDFGTPHWKQFNQGVLKLRVLALTEDQDEESNAISQSRVSDVWSSSSDTLHLLRLEVYTDWDLSSAKHTQDFTITVSEMLALQFEGNRLWPVLAFDVNPNALGGKVFKFRFLNSGEGQNQKGHFRVSDLEVFLDEKEGSRRPLTSRNRST